MCNPNEKEKKRAYSQRNHTQSKFFPHSLNSKIFFSYRPSLKYGNKNVIINTNKCVKYQSELQAIYSKSQHKLLRD